MGSPGIRRIGRRALAIAAGAAIALAAAEVGMRAAGLGRPNPYEQDPLLGTRLRSGLSIEWHVEADNPVEINEHGLRDARGVGPRTTEDELRVLVLGDSFVEALQVPLEDTFVQRLERLLEPAPGTAARRVEAINMGCSGHGTAQAYLRFLRDQPAYDPDLAVLCFFGGNDAADNHRDLAGATERPFFDLADDGTTLVGPDLSFWDATAGKRVAWRRALRALNQRSALLSWAAHQRWRAQMRSRGREISRAGLAVGLPPGRDVRIYGDPLRDPPLAEAHALTVALLHALADAARDAGVPLVLATVPVGAQVDPALASRLREACQEPNQIDFDRWDALLARVAAGEGVPLVAPAGAFRDERARRPDVPLHFEGSGHFTPEGHRVFAEALADGLAFAHPELVRRRAH
jgi:lysophospholipase L1-like esterase